MSEPKKRGRPKIQMDENLIYQMASKGCNDQDICSVLSNIEGKKISLEILRAKRSNVLEQGRASMRRRLHELQQELAGAKNPVMLIWLGKQHLGQADKVEANNKQVLQIQAADVWKSAFGTTPSKSVSLPKGVAGESEPPQVVH